MPSTKKNIETIEKKETYYDKYYKSLVGATILSFDGIKTDNLDEEDYQSGFPTFTVQFADKTISQIEISQDPEGNGGGFIFGLAIPEIK
jgi:hypothetical protein